MRRPAVRSLRRLAGVAIALGALGAATVDAQQPESLGNRRMVVLLFDVGSLQPDDLVLAVGSAQTYISDQMASADLVSVVQLGSRLNVLANFTSDRTQLKAALGSLTGGAVAAGDVGNDARLRGIRTLCETLAPIQQQKAVLFFSSGTQRNGDDNGTEVRETTNTCNRANVSLYPVDARGLAAAVAGGGATNRGSGGRDLFTGAR